MASGSDAVLEWHKQDKKRMLHAVYRVGDLDRAIKCYTECFGMKLLRKRDVPADKYTNAFLGYGPEDSNFALELTYNYGVDKYEIGEGFGHFAIATEDVNKMAEAVKASCCCKITREPGPVKGGSTVIAFAQDPDGYMFELIQRGSTPEPLCQVMLRVGDLERSIKFYEKALGMKLLRKKDVPDYKPLSARLLPTTAARRAGARRGQQCGRGERQRATARNGAAHCGTARRRYAARARGGAGWASSVVDSGSKNSSTVADSLIYVPICVHVVHT